MYGSLAVQSALVTDTCPTFLLMVLIRGISTDKSMPTLCLSLSGEAGSGQGTAAHEFRHNEGCPPPAGPLVQSLKPPCPTVCLQTACGN